MVQNNVFLLGKWLDLADDTYSTSKKLMYEMFTAKKSMNISMWLLHWSIELYLKAFLMSHNTKFGRTHDLICLFDQCVTIDSRLDNLCLQIPEVPNKQRYWINFINPFGKEDGGLRYLNKKRPGWSFPITIHDFFDDMIEYIRKNVDRNKVINRYI